MVVAWGYHKRTTLHYVFYYGFSREFLRWYLSTGRLWRSPVFHEWRRTRRVVRVCDVVKRFRAEFDGELLKQYEKAGLYNTLCGGRVKRDHFVYVCIAMASSRRSQAYRHRVETVLPWLVSASQRAYPRTLLTKREAAVLERRAMGEITKQIAVSEGISERTVREHLQQIKGKLYTNDLVNAVVIAIRSGMLPRGGPPAHQVFPLSGRAA
jgi:DNA-binding CsgD family transcriptional regulator